MYQLSEAVDMPFDAVVYFATIIISFIACLILGQIKSVPLSKLWAMMSGLFIGFFIYGSQYWANVIFVLINWSFMIVFRRV